MRSRRALTKARAEGMDLRLHDFIVRYDRCSYSSQMLVTIPDRTVVHGHVSPGFEPVREAFIDNFVHRHELGGACCVFYRGENVVDLWGGIRNERTGEPFGRDTMVIVHSSTKSMAATTLAPAHSHGRLHYVT